MLIIKSFLKFLYYLIFFLLQSSIKSNLKSMSNILKHYFVTVLLHRNKLIKKNKDEKK